MKKNPVCTHLSRYTFSNQVSSGNSEPGNKNKKLIKASQAMAGTNRIIKNKERFDALRVTLEIS